jgi:hypothetical protein
VELAGEGVRVGGAGVGGEVGEQAADVGGLFDTR